MSHSTKRKAPQLNPQEPNSDVLNNEDGRPKKKGKRGDRSRRERPQTLPTSTRYLPLVLGGVHWRGKKSLKNVVVFGDSYSKLSKADDDESQTWVECVLGSRKVSPIHTYNFAFPGATAEDDLLCQISRFEEHLDGASLDRERTTYFIYLGINDCGRTPSDDLEPIVEALFDVLHSLYTKFSARNFILIDVSPIDRSPGAVESDSADNIKERVYMWNELLKIQANDFAQGSPGATVFIFSSHHFLTELLDDPLDFDFTEDDPDTEGAGIWVDDLHLTYTVHFILAERLLGSLINS